VSFDLCACPSPEQHQLQHARVGDIWRDVHQVLPAPPDADQGAEALALTDEGAREQQRQCALEQASTKRGHESTQRHEQHMSCLVKDQIRQMPHRLQQRRLQT
jgi:hypothetical protein